MLHYLIFHPRVIVWIMWLISQGIYVHIVYILGHKVDYHELEVKNLKAHAILSTFSTFALVSNGKYISFLITFQCCLHYFPGAVLFRLIPVFATNKTKIFHMLVFLVALGLACWDLLSLYINVNELVPTGHKHFHSTHSIFGFITYIIFTLMVSFM